MLTEFANETLRVEVVDYHVESGYDADEPIITLYCRDQKKNRRTVEVEGFYPFFYMTEDEYEDRKNEVESDYRVRYTEKEKTDLHGEPLVKVVTVVPSDVPELRKSFNDHFEADVFFTNRFLITTGIKRGVEVPTGEDRVHVDDITPTEDIFDQKPRVATIDIEVLADGEFPEPTEAKNPITAVSAHDSYTDEYYAWILEPDTWSGEQEWELPDGVDHCEINVYDSENEMLNDINHWIMDIAPDILTGWNSNDFDYPYYVNRCLNINEWSVKDIAENVFVTKSGSAVIDNVELFDMLEAYKKMQIHELDSNSLGNVAQEVLGYGKEDIHDLDEGWKHDPVLFLKYNIRDVQAVVEIEEHEDVDIINTYDNLRSVTGATYTECHHNLSMIDMLFLRQAHEKGIALPTNEKPDRGWYYGAYVYNPSPGLHTNVLYPDLKSLYPYIMWSLNVSPETVYDSLDDVESDGYEEDDVYRAFVDRRSDEVKKETSPDESELYYLKPDVKEGFVREVIDDLVDMKYEYSGTSKYGAIKRVTNSVYGVFGDSESWGKGFRLYDWRLGESITIAGRHILKFTGEKFTGYLQENGYPNAKIVGGDTDSVMTSLPDADGMEDSLDAAFEAAKYVNMSYDDFMCDKFWICDPEMHKTEVEVESYADACFFLRDFKSNDPNKGVKKRYSQVIRWDEGDIIDDPSPKTKGFELVRSDVAQETKRVQKNVLDIVLTNHENPKEEIESYLKERVEAIENGDVSLEDLGVPSKINKKIGEYGEKHRRPMPYIRGAKWAMQNVPGESPGSGSKPLYFPVARVGGTDLPIVYSANTAEDEDEVDAIAVEDVRNIPDDVELDMDTIIEKNLKGPVNPILRTMNWSWDDLLADTSQTGLSAYM